MIKKGIILAGGMGSRLSPLTKVSNKQLLPLYDKPLIFYPLSVLMLSGIRKILIIVNLGQKEIFKKLLGNGSDFGLDITYKEQIKPRGLPDAFILGEKFIKNDSVALILGDNFFYGQGFTKRLNFITKKNKGSTIFAYNVKNPQDYGIVTLDKKNKIQKIEEKPKKPKTNFAITGLYFFDKNVVKYAKKLKPSKRGELEIIDVLKSYLKANKLNLEFIGRGGAWLDAGNVKDLFDASQFVASIEERQGLKIACLEEIAFNNAWIKRKNLMERIKFYGKCSYSEYLKSILK
ncbi:MAG: glucose-1-phosphate thymidylyltransferase [Pelagibacterales bacterium]|jgi:glucose-1-phosphate thymidylyltransferase|nr:glucose-1-phosphate thymidylyltransferase [Pelagibacterales bacterium]